MGGAASTDIPEKLTEDDLKRLCGDKYEDVIYRSLRDVEGNVSREQFIKVVSDSLEKEVFSVYQTFCPHGDMDSRTFVKLCKDAKLMKKNQMTATDCDLMFQRARSHAGVTTKTINFSTFRHTIIDEISAKKGLEPNQIMTKIARVEGPTLHGTHAEAVKFHDDKSTFTGSHAQGGPDFHHDSNKVELNNLLDRKEADVRGVAHSVVVEHPTAAPTEQHRAAIRVQTIHRKNTAKKLLDGMKDVNETAAKPVDPDKDFDKPKFDDVNEADANETFEKFAVRGEIDSRSFIKLCKDANILNRTCTATDADLIFQKTKAKASAPGAGSYSSGVVHGKRVSYEVFRAVAVPLLAEKRGVSVDKIIEMIAMCSGPVMSNTTKAEATKFHDDPSTYTGVHSASQPV